MESALWVMPLTRVVADALGVVTICLVALLVLLGFCCILYSVYFRSHIHTPGFIQLSYFSRPWIIRIVFILFAICWGCGEIVRLNLLRQEGSVSDNLSLEWQETVCKIYVVTNLGFAEPCLFLSLVFLVRASLLKTESGTLNKNWNLKTAGYVLLCCLPFFVLQLIVVLIGPAIYEGESFMHKKAHYTAAAYKMEDRNVALCTYPLLSTIFLGLFAIVLTTYLFWLGRGILNLVINKGLQKRVYALILSVCSFFPLRVLFLGLTVLSRPEQLAFEALSFLAFLSLLCCVGVGICILVYFPVADALALRKLQDLESRRRISDQQHNIDSVSLIANDEIMESPGRSSVTSVNRGSISFRTSMERDEHSGEFIELGLLYPSQHSTTAGPSRLLGWPMVPPTQVHEAQKQTGIDNLW